MEEYDLIVVGTGPAASTVLSETDGEDMRRAVVEERELGGTCALRGCNPKKVLVYASEVVDWADRMREAYLEGEPPTIDWHRLIRFKSKFTDPVPQARAESYARRGIDVYKGRGRFVGPDVIRAGDAKLQAEQIALCTGARPRPLDIPGADLLTASDEFLELDHLPERVVFVGGGYISFEFAHVAAHAGSRVCVLEARSRPLRRFDTDMVNCLVERSRSYGMDVRANAPVQSIRRVDEDVLEVVLESENGSTEAIRAGLAVHGAGRVPDVHDMGLEAAGVELKDGGIAVDEYMHSTSNPHVWAAGDCTVTGALPLTPVAHAEARALVHNILHGTSRTPDYGPVPTVLYSVPPVATVGLHQSQAEEQGLEFELREGQATSWGYAAKVRERCASYKILLEKGTGRILGAHLTGPRADEVINLFALAMRNQGTAQDMLDTLLAFPTAGYYVKEMLKPGD